MHAHFNFVKPPVVGPAFYDSEIDGETSEEILEPDRPFMDYFVICNDNPIKSKLDAWIMLLVTYSCITTLYNSAFTPLERY